MVSANKTILVARVLAALCYGGGHSMRCGGPGHGCFLGMAKPLRGSLMDRPAPCNSHRGDRKSPRIARGYAPVEVAEPA